MPPGAAVGGAWSPVRWECGQVRLDKEAGTTKGLQIIEKNLP